MIKTPADLKGLKIRVQNSPVAIKMVEALGGSPTPIAWVELYSALAQGTVDGAENNPPSYLSEKHCEVAPYFSKDAMLNSPGCVATYATSMGERAGVTRNEIPIGPWHVRVVIPDAIGLQPKKRGPKRPVTTTCIVNEIANLLALSRLLRSDPNPPAFRRMLVRFQVPRPRIVERNPLGMPCQRELSFCQRLLDFRSPKTIPKAHARAS